MKLNNKVNFLKGLKDGTPIALGYLAISFTIGIAGRDAGLKWWESTLMSALNYTSAGQASAISIIKEGGSYLTLALSTLIINLRYLLMSTALTVKLSPETTIKNRLVMGMGVTDEIFAITIGREYPINPYYMIGATTLSLPGWALGTALGGIMGEILPSFISSSLSIALYAMFIAIIIPPCKGNKVLLVLVLLSMILSFLFTKIPVLKNINIGMKVIILTIVLSSIFALLFPREEDEE